MANPFFVEPANPLQALLAGQQGYDSGVKRMQENAISAAAPDIAAGNWRAALAKIGEGGGNLQALLGVAGLANSERDFGLRSRVAGETERAHRVNEEIARAGLAGKPTDHVIEGPDGNKYIIR